MEVLRVLAGKADLYLITQCEAQDDFDSVHEALLSCGIFTAGLNPVVCLLIFINKSYLFIFLIVIYVETFVVLHSDRQSPHSKTIGIKVAH